MARISGKPTNHHMILYIYICNYATVRKIKAEHVMIFTPKQHLLNTKNITNTASQNEVVTHDICVQQDTVIRRGSVAVVQNCSIGTTSTNRRVGL